MTVVTWAPYGPGVTADAPTPAALATLRASRAQQEAVVRWLRPLAPLVMVVVVWAAFGARPGPGLGGRGLAVSIALAGFVAAGVGVLATVRRPDPVHVG